MILSYIRTIVLYLILIFVIRMMGKRQIGEMEPAEFVVTMLVANLASIPMQDGAIPLFSGLMPILTVLGVELAISGLSMKSITLRRFFCGKPVILIENGKVIQSNLRATRISIDELTGHLRQKEILHIADVQYAILETNGELSVFPYPEKRPPSAWEAGVRVSPQTLPYTLVEDGRVLEENLRASGLDRGWLNKELGKRGVRVEDTLYLLADAQGGIQFQKREKTP